MQAGDLVRVDKWVAGGPIGTIIEMQSGAPAGCAGAWVLLENGSLRLIRIGNLKVVYEDR